MVLAYALSYPWSKGYPYGPSPRGTPMDFQPFSQNPQEPRGEAFRGVGVSCYPPLERRSCGLLGASTLIFRAVVFQRSLPMVKGEGTWP